MEQTVRIGESDSYSFYAIIALIFDVIYIVGIGLAAFVDTTRLTVTLRDGLSGAFLVAMLFGAPVAMFVGALGIAYTRIEQKRGKIFGIFALILPVIFWWTVNAVWYPQHTEFWKFNFSKI